MPRRKAAETLTDKKRKLMVEAIFTAQLEGKSLAEAWLLTHPESNAKPECRRVMAQKQIGWYNEKYPTGYEQLVRRRDAQERRRQQRRENHRRREPDMDIEEERRLDRELEERGVEGRTLELDEEGRRELEEWSKRREKDTLADDQILPAGQRPTVLRRDGRTYTIQRRSVTGHRGTGGARAN